MEKNDYQSEEIHTSYHTPAGTFTRKRPQIVQTPAWRRRQRSVIGAEPAALHEPRRQQIPTDTEQLTAPNKNLEDCQW